MKTLTKILGVGGLLAALGSGCDRETDQDIGHCEIDVKNVHVIYHQIKGFDTYELLFDNRGRIEVQAADGDKIKSGWFRCTDGRILQFGKDQDQPNFSYSERRQ